jgi:hypothetical protein
MSWRTLRLVLGVLTVLLLAGLVTHDKGRRTGHGGWLTGPLGSGWLTGPFGAG